ncbi:MAG TPA: class I SAM-dependent methyltransferase [Rhizomicrobium sp.]
MLKKLAGTLRPAFGHLWLLFRTSAPLAIYVHYFLHLLTAGRTARFKPVQDSFIAQQNSLRLTNPWFGRYIPYWLDAFERCGLLAPGRPLAALEIGSWEGQSGNFIQRTLTNARLTCVDTWEGGDEHKDMAALAIVEANFDSNLRPFQDRLTKFKGTSARYFALGGTGALFDLIYVDGSHHSDDVVVDAVKGFEVLKNGGVMIFDDYFWRHYRNPSDNPAGAINAFLRLKKDSYRIVRAYYQLIIQKRESGQERALR